MKLTSNKLVPYIAVISASVIIGFSYIFVKKGVHIVSAIDLLADRLLIATLFLFLLRFFRLVKTTKILLKDKFALIILSLFYPVLYFGFQNLGIGLTTASEASIIYAMLPVFTLIFSGIFLNEKSNFIQKTGIILSVVGIAYIAVQSFENISGNLSGYFFIFLSLLAMVGYYIKLKSLAKKVSILTITFHILLYSMLMVNIFNIFRYMIDGDLMSYYDRFLKIDYLIIILYLGILSTLGTSFLTNFSLKYLTTSQVSIFNNLSPIIGVLAGVSVLNEQLFHYHIMGGIIVLSGISLTLFYSKIKKAV